MSNELVLIETRIHEGDAALDAADKHAGKAVEMKKAAGLIYNDAAKLCEAAGLSFKTECKRLTSRSYSQVSKARQIVNAPDPDAEEKRQREANNVSHLKETVQSRIRDQEPEIELWEAEPKTPLPVEERPHVKALKAGLMNCSPEEREHVLTWATCL